jgi:hypothetical protein
MLTSAFLLSSILAGCGTAQQLEEATQPTRCQTVPSAAIEAIETGLENGLSLRDAFAVRSRDYKRVFMVSADIQGPGFEGTDDVATWGLNQLAQPQSVFSAENLAEEFSDWGPLPDGSPADDGISESGECVREAISP